jgi:hypothetical protein
MHSTYNIKMGLCVVVAILGIREDVGHVRISPFSSLQELVCGKGIRLK